MDLGRIVKTEFSTSLLKVYKCALHPYVWVVSFLLARESVELCKQSQFLLMRGRHGQFQQFALRERFHLGNS